MITKSHWKGRVALRSSDWRGPYFLEECDEETRSHLTAVADVLAKAGARIDEIELPGTFWDYPSIAKTVGNAEIAAAYEKDFRENPDSFAPVVRGGIESGNLVSAVEYINAQRLRRQFGDDLNDTAERFDALLTPSTPTPPQPDLSDTGDAKFQSPWTLAGLPAISLPSGASSEGLPMGIQLISSGFSEGKLLAVAQWCEREIEFDLKP